MISIASIAMGNSINKTKKRNIRVNRNTKLYHFTEYSLLILAISIVLLIGCLIEAYLAPVFLRFFTDYLN